MLNAVPDQSPRIAYLMSWFPAVSETFILDEMLELERQGLTVEIYPLLGQHTTLLHPGAEALVRRARYCKVFSREFVLAQLFWLTRRPGAYLRLWIACLWWNLPSVAFFVRSILVIPKAMLIAREMQAAGIQHVHAHWATHPTLAAFIIRELTGISYSFTTHAHDLYIDRTMLKQKVAGATFVATISELNRRLLIEHCGSSAAEKTQVVRCGVDPALFPYRARPLRERPFTMACVATLRDYKGHPYLVEACRLLKTRGLTFRLLLVGDGPERDRLTQLIAEAGLQEDIELCGALSRPAVRSILSKADAMVLPSIITSYGKMEGIPVSLIEAMCSGVPVVSTNISALSELITSGESGLLVPQRDPVALAQAITTLMEQPELATQFSVAGRTTILQKFTLTENVQQLYRLLIGLQLETEAELPSPPSKEAQGP